MLIWKIVSYDKEKQQSMCWCTACDEESLNKFVDYMTTSFNSLENFSVLKYAINEVSKEVTLQSIVKAKEYIKRRNIEEEITSICIKRYGKNAWDRKDVNEQLSIKQAIMLAIFDKFIEIESE